MHGLIKAIKDPAKVCGDGKCGKGRYLQNGVCKPCGSQASRKATGLPKKINYGLTTSNIFIAPGTLPPYAPPSSDQGVKNLFVNVAYNWSKPGQLGIKLKHGNASLTICTRPACPANFVSRSFARPPFSSTNGTYVLQITATAPNPNPNPVKNGFLTSYNITIVSNNCKPAAPTQPQTQSQPPA
jgi:hypothetical protein